MLSSLEFPSLLNNDANRTPSGVRNDFRGSTITPSMFKGILIVVGMNREAHAARALGRVVVGAEALARALGDGATGVLSFGLCGGLDPALGPGDLVIGNRVRAGDHDIAVDAEWLERLTRALPDVAVGGVAGTDTIVGASSAKAALRIETGAVATDMESHRAALAALEAGVPFAILRAVSDGASDSLPLCAQMGFRPDGSVDIGAVVRGLMTRPSEFPALMRTAHNAGLAMAALTEAANRLSTSP
jgi:adenosylhomocysteine nucleosidase